MTLEIHNPADRRFLKCLFFGPSGHGKTHLLGSAQEDERTSPMLLLDFEGGVETLSGLDIDVAPIRGWDDYSEAYELLSEGDHDYKSVGIDSISETHIFALQEILRREGPSRRDPDLVEMGDYGRATTQMRRLLREFRDLPLHVFYTSHAKEAEERGVGKVKVPSLAGQMAEEVVGLMSIAGYLAIGEDEDTGEEFRSLILRSNPKYRTKLRLPWDREAEDAPDELDDPTIGGLLDIAGISAPRKRSTTKKKTTKKEDDE